MKHRQHSSRQIPSEPRGQSATITWIGALSFLALLAVGLTFWISSSGNLDITALAAVVVACPAALLLTAGRDGDGDSGDEDAAPTIVALPTWMIEEEQKKLMDDGDPEESKKTVAFDPAEAEDFRRQMGLPGPPDPLESATQPTTASFDPQEAQAVRDEVRGVEKPFSTQELLVVSPSESGRSAEKKVVPGDQDDAFAPTQLYMPAASAEDAAETAVYSPEEKDRLLLAFGADQASPKPAPESAAGSTMVYSQEDSQKFREEYGILHAKDQAQAAGLAPIPDSAPSSTEPAEEGESSVPSAARAISNIPDPIAAEETDPKSSTTEITEEFLPKRRGKKVVLWVLVILVVLGAGAFALHYFDIVHLPIDLPQKKS